jgi:hypothetical protein
MRNYAFIAGFALFSSLAGPASAQIRAPGDLDLNGRVLLKVLVGMTDPGELNHPVSGLTIVVLGTNSERTEIRSDDAGIATAWLFSGTYRIVSLDTVTWERKPYSWDVIVQVLPGMGALRLTQENSMSAPAGAAPTVRAEPKPPAAQAVRPPPVTPQAARPQPVTAQPVTTQPVTAQPVTPPPDTTKPMVAPPSPPQAAPTTRASQAPGRAQRTRQGFWVNASVGYGRLGCYLCNGYFNGLAVGASFGGTLSSRLLLGLGTSGWTKSDGGVTRTLGTLDGRLRYYLGDKGGLFLTSGLGLGMIGRNVSGFGSDSEIGVGFVVGIGMDFRVASHLSVTPFGNAFAIRTANSDASVGQIGFGLTFH